MKLTINDRINFDLQQINSCDWLIGLDEVGWGCIAGDLVIGAVVIHKDLLNNWDFNHKVLSKIRDSKKLTEKVREEINKLVQEYNFEGKLFWTIGQSDISVINDKGLAIAYDEALEQILREFSQKVDISKTLLLLDGSRVPGFLKTYNINKNIVVKGDDQSLVIGLASILAKQYRDQLMTVLDLEFPMYNWASNKGYGTADHIKALKEFGLSKYHRTKGSTTILSD